MKETVVKLLLEPLTGYDVWVDDAFVEVEDGIKYFRIVLDSKTIIDLDQVVELTRMIDPIITEADLIEDSYVLDIYAKEKGENKR